MMLYFDHRYHLSPDGANLGPKLTYMGNLEEDDESLPDVTPITPTMHCP